MAEATLVRWFPVTLDLVLRSGEQIRIRYTLDVEEVGEGTEVLVGSLAAFSPAD